MSFIGMSVFLLDTEGEAVKEEKPISWSCHCRKERRTKKATEQINISWETELNRVTKMIKCKNDDGACYLHRLP